MHFGHLSTCSRGGACPTSPSVSNLLSSYQLSFSGLRRNSGDNGIIKLVPSPALPLWAIESVILPTSIGNEGVFFWGEERREGGPRSIDSLPRFDNKDEGKYSATSAHIYTHSGRTDRKSSSKDCFPAALQT